jgi:hypothetical protein
MEVRDLKGCGAVSECKRYIGFTGFGGLLGCELMWRGAWGSRGSVDIQTDTYHEINLIKVLNVYSMYNWQNAADRSHA